MEVEVAKIYYQVICGFGIFCRKVILVSMKKHPRPLVANIFKFNTHGFDPITKVHPTYSCLECIASIYKIL